MFWKKSKDKIKTLSEGEIQERLYGVSLSSEMVGEPKTRSAQGESESLKPDTQQEPKSHTSIFSQEENSPVSSSTELFEEPAQIQTETDVLVEERPQEEPVEEASPKVSESVSAGSTSGGMELFDGAPSRNRAEQMEIVWQKIEDFIDTSVETVKKVPVYFFLGVALLIIIAAGIYLGLKFWPHGTGSSGPPPKVTVSDTKPKDEAPVKPAAPGPAAVETSSRGMIPPSSPLKEESLPKHYSIQLCLSDDIAASERVIDKLRVKGYEGYIRKIRGSRGNQLYQIFVGRYKTSGEAQKALKALRQDPEMKSYDDSFVRTSK